MKLYLLTRHSCWKAKAIRSWNGIWPKVLYSRLRSQKFHLKLIAFWASLLPFTGVETMKLRSQETVLGCLASHRQFNSATKTKPMCTASTRLTIWATTKKVVTKFTTRRKDCAILKTTSKQVWSSSIWTSTYSWLIGRSSVTWTFGRMWMPTSQHSSTPCIKTGCGIRLLWRIRDATHSWECIASIAKLLWRSYFALCFPWKRGPNKASWALLTHLVCLSLTLARTPCQYFSRKSNC